MAALAGTRNASSATCRMRGIGLGEAAALGGDHDLEAACDSRRGEPRALHAVDAVGHDAEPVALAESLEHAPAAGQPVAPRREPVEVDLAETHRAPCVGADLQQQLAEALARERGL